MNDPQIGFVLYQDVWMQWRWALYSPESIKIAESAVGYGNRAAAIEAARRLPGLASQALGHFSHAGAGRWVV